MLNHRFYLESNSNQREFIRISDKFIKKMESELLRHRFIWNGYDEPMNGLNKGLTFFKINDIKVLRTCLLEHSGEKEYNKFMNFIDRAISVGAEICHEDGSHGSLAHGFILVSDLPDEISYRDFEKDAIKIQDQFIREYYDVFKNVEMFWDTTEEKGNGFNYYGDTIITPIMAQELVNNINEFLTNHGSEEAEYFVGEEFDLLLNILNQAVLENKYIVHFGI